MTYRKDKKQYYHSNSYFMLVYLTEKYSEKNYHYIIFDQANYVEGDIDDFAKRLCSES